MDRLNILIVEDETLTALHLRQTLEAAGHRVTGIARTLQAAVRSVQIHQPDLALIDIELAEESIGNGIETARTLLNQQPMPIIYLTANSESKMFQAAKETLPAAYLIKPFDPSELLFNVDLAYHYFRNVQVGAPNPGYLLLPVSGGLERIDLENVMYLEADGAYAKLFMRDKTIHTVSTHLGQLEYYFHTTDFFRLSRSHIINLCFVKRIKDNELLLIDGHTTLPLPSSNRKELLNRMTVVRTKPMSKK